MMKRTICMLAALSLALCSFPAAAQSVDATGATGGEIVILQNPDGSLLYAVSLGGARVAYADAGTGFVVSVELSSMSWVNAYVWKPSSL